jgi:hypothetical protein
MTAHENRRRGARLIARCTRPGRFHPHKGAADQDACHPGGRLRGNKTTTRGTGWWSLLRRRKAGLALFGVAGSGRRDGDV